MKSLYESILSSTKSGSYALIEDWCKKHLRSMKNGDDEHGWMINSKMRVTNWTNGRSVNTIQIPSEYGLDIPDYIKFEGNEDGNFMIGQALNHMKPEQLPECCEVLYISGYTKTIPSFKMRCMSGLYINDYSQLLTKIEPIEIEMHSTQNGNKKPIINLSNTKIDIESLKNIHVTGEVNRLNIQKTPAAETIKKFIQKNRPDKLKRGECPECEDYLSEMFKSLPGLRYIELSDRSHIEWNERMQKWYLF